MIVITEAFYSNFLCGSFDESQNRATELSPKASPLLPRFFSWDILPNAPLMAR